MLLTDKFLGSALNLNACIIGRLINDVRVECGVSDSFDEVLHLLLRYVLLQKIIKLRI